MTIRGFSILLFVCASIGVVNCQIASNSVDSIEYVYGVVKNDNSPQPIFYNTYGTIIKKFTFPNIDYKFLKLDTTVPMSSFAPCKLTEFDNKCPSIYFLDQLMLDYPQAMRGEWKSLFGPKNVNNFTSTISKNKKECGEIKTGSSSSHLLESSMHDYVENTLKSYCNKVVYQLPTADNLTIINSKYFYSNMSQKISVTHYNHIGSTTGILIAMNSHFISQELFFQNLFQELNSYAQAIQICQQGRIPSGLLPLSELIAAIGNLVNMKTDYNLYKLPIVVASDYYSLPLAECTLIDDKTLHLQVKIPMVLKSSNYTMFNLNVIPFLRKDIKNDDLCVVGRVEGKSFIQDSLTDSFLLENLNCREGELCFVPQHASELPLKIDYCALAFLKNSSIIFDLHCQLECMDKNLRIGPSDIMVRSVSADTLAITGGDHNSNLHLFISCNFKPMQVIKLVENGALLVTIPCNCQIIFKSVELFRSTKPCFGKVSIQHIFPRAWNISTPENETTTSTDSSNSYYTNAPKLFGIDSYEAAPKEIVDKPLQCDCDNYNNDTDVYLLYLLVGVCFVAIIIYSIATIFKFKKIEAKLMSMNPGMIQFNNACNDANPF